MILPSALSFLALWIFTLGLVVGSFLNVVILRLPHHRSIIRPGSHCPRCLKGIRWWQNLPVLSYLLLRGKCGSCGCGISPRYPLVEILTGVLFLAAFYKVGFTPSLFVRDLPWLSLLVAISFIDLDHRIIPDRLSLPGVVLGLLTSFIPDTEPGWQSAFLGSALGFGGFYAISWLYYIATKKVGLGGGDIKLLAMIGAFIGPLGVFWTILISSLWGSIVGIGYGLIKKEGQIFGVTIPYGPFLVLGALTYYFLGHLPLFEIF